MSADTHDMHCNATEAAQVLSQLVPSLELQDAQDLRRLLGHDIAAPTRARIREARLGLLVQMLTVRTDARLPNEPEYDELRAARLTDGEEWPTSRTLINAYGHWLSAAGAAANHVRGVNENGKRIKVPSSYHHCRPHKAYGRQDVIDDIDWVRQGIQRWPTEWEYQEYCRVARAAARARGETKLRVVGLKQIRTWFGSFPAAQEASRRFQAAHDV